MIVDIAKHEDHIHYYSLNELAKNLSIRKGIPHALFFIFVHAKCVRSACGAIANQTSVPNSQLALLCNRTLVLANNCNLFSHFRANIRCIYIDFQFDLLPYVL